MHDKLTIITNPKMFRKKFGAKTYIIRRLGAFANLEGSLLVN
jgi:hypothetical protein